ncbi:MAG: chemotaxis protein CheD [Candidatus Hydrogenedentes bacterium]|nr:chemotaxis protein CheD [Candidatus Hydrogenedentota bacterium]
MTNVPSKITYYLEPGFVYVSRQGATVRTVLGTCVAVCLWDKVLRYGGINHFVWPAVTTAAEATPTYGNVATAALVRMMEEAGCRRCDLVAQILGGAAPEPIVGDHVGRQNVRVAREMLSRKGIQIIADDTGGSVGRKIMFDTGTGELAVLKVWRLRASDWHV